MNHLLRFAFGLSASAAVCLVLAGPEGSPPPGPEEKPQRLTGTIHHIGNSEKPEWKDFTTVKAEHPSHLKLTFGVEREGQEATLEILSGGVGSDWLVKLNDRGIGALKKGEAAQTLFLEVPAGLLRKTQNELVVETVTADDDVFLGPIVLHHRPLAEVLRLGEVRAVVKDARTGLGLPCRLTVTRLAVIREKGKKEEELAEIREKESRDLAIRRGIVYTSSGEASFHLPAGRYRIYATRGFEYGVASQTVELSPSERQTVRLKLEREVDTTGYLAADTHIHTRTYSGHGDATLEERMVTIAGEGVEVAVATDHNHHTDYAPAARKAGLDDRFYSIVGNEFTTAIGHFNAFPMEKGAKPAPYGSRSWVKLVAALRATPGVQVVICNHPRRAKSDEEAFNNIELNPLSGEAHRGPALLGIDAVEVLNARGLHDDRFLTFRDWFALVNRGQLVAAVAGSDSHTVEGIVGQSRTYVKCASDDPRRADLREITSSFREGRLLLSLGLLCDVKVNGRFGVGDLATGLHAAAPGGTVPSGEEDLEVEVTVTGPRWSKADEVVLYLNGEVVRKEAIRHSDQTVVKYHSTWKLPAPRHDAHLVVIASGPPITAPFWALAHEKKYVMGATNPVWLDGDGDGRFTSAFEYAERLVHEKSTEPSTFHQALAGFDAPVAVEAASILRQRVQSDLQAEYERIWEKESERLSALLVSQQEPVNRRFQAYLKNTPPIEVVTRRERTAEALQEKQEREKEEKDRIEKEKKAAAAKKAPPRKAKKRY